MNILIWLVYVVNSVAALFVFAWAYRFFSRHNFVGQFTSRSQRYRKTGMELGCMEICYRFIFSALPTLVVLLPSILIYDLRSDGLDLDAISNSEQSDVEPLSAEETSRQILEDIDREWEDQIEEANKAEEPTPNPPSN